MLKNNFKFPSLFTCNVSVIGLGYVGLPIAIELDKTKKCYLTGKPLSRNIVGFDINKERIDQLNANIDLTNEISVNDLKKIRNLSFSYSTDSVLDSDVFIVTVPTPINQNNDPDLTPIIKASEFIGKTLFLRLKKK